MGAAFVRRVQRSAPVAVSEPSARISSHLELGRGLREQAFQCAELTDRDASQDQGQ